MGIRVGLRPGFEDVGMELGTGEGEGEEGAGFEEDGERECVGEEG